MTPPYTGSCVLLRCIAFPDQGPRVHEYSSLTPQLPRCCWAPCILKLRIAKTSACSYCTGSLYTIMSALSFPQKRHACSHPTCPHTCSHSSPTHSPCILGYVCSTLPALTFLITNILPQLVGPSSPLCILLSLPFTFLNLHQCWGLHLDSHTYALRCTHMLHMHVHTQQLPHSPWTPNFHDRRLHGQMGSVIVGWE